MFGVHLGEVIQPAPLPFATPALYNPANYQNFAVVNDGVIFFFDQGIVLPASPQAPAAGAAPGKSLVDDIESMSDEEVDRLVALRAQAAI